MNKEKFEEYASIKQQIAALEERADALRPDLVQAMIDEDTEKIELTGYGNFVLESKRSWKYSAHLEDMKQEIKEQEKQEKADGTATYEENVILKFMSK